MEHLGSQDLLTTIPWAVVGFFLIRVINKVDQVNDMITKFSDSIMKLDGKIESIVHDMQRSQESLNQEIKRHESVIELLRRRTHQVVNEVTGIKMKLHIHGIKFDSLTKIDLEGPENPDTEEGGELK